jgi:uncharacterized membrane protein
MVWLRETLEKFNKPDLFFFCVAITFGLCFVFFTAPFQSPDEYQHFNHVYTISTGQISGISGEIPQSIYKMEKYFPAGVTRISIDALLPYLVMPLEKEKTQLLSFPNVSVYSPLPNLPQALGILIARSINLSPLELFWAGRTFNLLFWIFLNILAIRVTPAMRWAFVLLALMPMNLFQAASISPDTMLNGLSLLILAFFLRLIIQKEKFDLKTFFVLSGLGVGLAFCKPNYVVLMGLFLVVPITRFNSKKKFFLTGLALIVIVIIAAYLSLQIGKDQFMQFRGNGGAQPNDQVNFLIQHPARIFTIFWKSIRILGLVYLQSYIGLLGWLDTPLPNFIYYTYPFFLFLAVLSDPNDQVKLKIYQRFIFATIPAIAFFMIFLALYITWTKYRQSWVDGLQGRYLIPIIPPALVAIYNNSREIIKTSFLRFMVSVYVIYVLFVTSSVLLHRYYSF